MLSNKTKRLVVNNVIGALIITIAMSFPINNQAVIGGIQ